MRASNPFVAGLVAGSLLMSSTAAVAATSPAPAPQISSWTALTMLSGGAPAAALCGAAAVAAAAQTTPGCVLPVVDTPPPVAGPPTPVPVPPVEPVGGGLGIDPLLLALGAIALGVGIYFLVRNNNNEESPA